MALVMREVERLGQRLRVWDDARGLLGDGGEGVAVEWAGQFGHPSSYGLLGGRESQADQTDHVVSVRFVSRLAGASDWVEFGLPDEYLGAVLDEFGSQFEVVVAAHDRIGSSERVFRRLARMVTALLAQPVTSDAELWALWDSTA
jgi:hypothetical protein